MTADDEVIYGKKWGEQAIITAAFVNKDRLSCLVIDRIVDDKMCDSKRFEKRLLDGSII